MMHDTNPKSGWNRVAPIGYDLNSSLNKVIGNVFQRGVENDTSSFICRVLHEIVKELEIDCVCAACGHSEEAVLMAQHKREWAEKVFAIYFDPQDIPILYSRIHFEQSLYQDMYHRGHIREVFQRTVIKYSNEYYRKRGHGTLNCLSTLYDDWRKEDYLNTAEELHMYYMQRLQTIYEDQVDELTFNNLLIYRFYLILQHSRSITVTRRRDCQRDSYYNRAMVMNLVVELFSIFMERSEVKDKSFLGQTGTISRALGRAMVKLDITELERTADVEFDLSGVYYLMSQYYFWQKFNRQRAIFYIRLGIDRAVKRMETVLEKKLLDDLCLFELMLRNFRECVKILDYRSQRKGITLSEFQNLQRKKREVINMMTRCRGYDLFDPLDREQHQSLIKKQFVGMKKSVIPLYNKMKGLLKKEDNVNIVMNIIKGKECHYQKCGRKDFKIFGVCSRCRAVFYCSRRHQKLDWNESHRNECLD